MGLIISSHGIPDYIVTSDYKLYSRLAIQRTSSFYAILRTIPRLILFDCCSGKQSKGIAPTIVDVKKEDDEKKEMDKNLKTNNLDKKIDEIDIFNADHDKTVKWGLNEENPDHLVATINASNHGFVSRLDRRFGSLCIHRFYQKYCWILDAKKREIPFIHEIFEEIQEELQFEGKQLPEAKWNDSTQYIVFKKNKNPI